MRTSFAVLSLLAAQAGLCLAQDGPLSGDSNLQAALEQSQQEGRFTFVVFYRENSPQSQKMLEVVQQSISVRDGQAKLATTNVADPAEQTMIQRFGVSRAPMPMTVVVAPNGAVTGLFPRQVTETHLTSAIVPPVMMQCMKELQNQKLVFVCLTRNEQAAVPASVRALQLDPQFKDRMTLVGLNVHDTAEAKLMSQLKVDANQIHGPYAALIAPPGVLVGHFTGTSTAEQIAAAIHKAGQCCDDPTCKHAGSAQASQTSATLR